MSGDIRDPEAAALLAILLALMAELDASGAVDAETLCKALISASNRCDVAPEVKASTKLMAGIILEAVAGPTPPKLRLVGGD